MFSTTETYSLAHTAECKLHIAAKRPDRNLRFLLGHAFTLDKINLRIVQIEEEQENMEKITAANQKPAGDGQRRVSFSERGREGGRGQPRGRSNRMSPPPEKKGVDSDSDDNSTESEEEEYDEEAEESLDLVRFQSASAMPPRKLPDTAEDDDSSSSEEDLDEPTSPPASLYSDDILREIVGGTEDETLTELYNTVKSCPCQGTNEEHDHAPEIKGIWVLPDPELTPQQAVPMKALIAV